MRALGLIATLMLVSCGEPEPGNALLDTYTMPVKDLDGRIPKPVVVCFGLQAAHLAGEREAGLEQDIADTCARSAREEALSDECRTYAKLAADYGRTLIAGADTSELIRKSNAAFARCRR